MSATTLPCRRWVAPRISAASPIRRTRAVRWGRESRIVPRLSSRPHQRDPDSHASDVSNLKRLTRENRRSSAAAAAEQAAEQVAEPASGAAGITRTATPEEAAEQITETASTAA